MNNQYDVAAYFWPAYTGDDPRARILWPEGYGEWETIKNAIPKFPGHQWPRKPRWGYVNEADPYVMEMQLSAAADHGVSVLIYDWYWYDRQPFLENCLNDGYLKARNNSRVKFYLMWANHDANTIWDYRNAIADHTRNPVIWMGAVDRPEFEKIARRLIDKYFRHPSYYCIDDKPVFMIYDLQNLLDGLGGVSALCKALEWFREEAVRSGLPGIHLQVAEKRVRFLNVSGVDGQTVHGSTEATKEAGFDSLTHYHFIHFTDINREYGRVMGDVLKEWARLDEEYAIPYFPHVSIAWDNNPRFKELRPMILRDNTAEKFKDALLSARSYLDARPGQVPLLTINSWNEWTEGGYLEPDDLNGYGYLKAVKDVFKAVQSVENVLTSIY